MAEVASQEIQKYSTLVKLQPDNGENHFQLGLAYENAGQVAESNKCYEQCLKLLPRHSLAYLHRGFHLARAGDPDRALVEWSKAFEYDSNLSVKFATDPHTQREYKQKIDSSIQSFTKPILINPKNAFAHYQLGTAYKFFNLLELSLQSLKRALDINPRLWEGYHTCGEIYSRLEQNKLAINNFKLAIEANPRYADSHFQLASVYERENQSTLAIKHLEEAIKLDPDRAPYYFAFGRVLMKQTKYKVAMQQIQKGLNLDKNNAQGYLLLADCCKELYRPDLALVSYERAVENNPNFAAAIYELGTIALQLGEIDKAISSFERALELNNEDPYAQYHLAQAYQRKGDFAKAEGHYSQASVLSPKDAFAAYNLAVVRQELGNQKGALEAFRKAVDLKPQDATYHLMLAKCAMGLEHHDEAVSHLREAIKHNPNDLETNFLLADVMMQTGQFDAAIAMFGKVTEITPDSVDAHTRLAEAFHRLEMFDYAFESYQQALRLDSKHISSLHGMGVLYLRYRNKPSIAVDFFQQALELDPSHAASLASLGEAYIALNQPDRALEFFERKLDQNRENAEYLSKYGEALALVGQTAKAIEELKRALQLAPESVLMRQTLARLYFQDKRYADALDQFQRLIQQQPKEAEHHYQLGLIYEQLGDKDKAGRAYNEALERRPEHREAMERLEVIYEGQEVPRPKPKPVEQAQPASSYTSSRSQAEEEEEAGDDPLGNLEALLGVGSFEESPPPPPPSAPAESAPPAPAPTVQEENADDLLSSLMGSQTESNLADMMDTSLEEMFGISSDPTPPPPAPTEPEPEPEPDPVPEPVAAAPASIDSAPVTPTEEGDLSDFLRDLGYSEEDEVQAPPAPPEPEPEPEVEKSSPEESSVEALLGVTTEAEIEETSIEDLLGLTGAESAPEAPPAVPEPEPAAAEEFSVEDLLGLTDTPAAPAAPPAPAAEPEDSSIEALLGLTVSEEAPAATESAPEAAQPQADPEPEPSEAEATAAEEPAAEEPEVPASAPEARVFADLEDQLEVVRDFIDMGKLDKAKPRLDKLIDANPGHPQVLDLLFQVASEESNFEQAAAFAQQWSESQPTDAVFEKWVDACQKSNQDQALAQAYSAWKQYNSAAPVPESAEPTPAAPEYLELEAQGAFAEAIASIAAGPEAHHGEMPRLYQLWRDQLEEKQDFSGALEVVAKQQELLGTSPSLQEESLRLYGAWAESLEAESNWAEACQVYQKQLQALPENPSGLSNLERIYQRWSGQASERQEYESALSVWEKAHEFLPEMALTRSQELYQTWAKGLLENQDFASALNVVEQARAYSDLPELKNLQTQVLMGWSAHWENEGDLEQAIDCIKRLNAALGNTPERDSQIVSLYKNWAEYLKEDGQQEAAEEVFARLRADFPDAEIPSQEAADPWEELGAEGQADLGKVEEFLQAHPEHESAQARRLALRREQLDELMKAFRWDEWEALLGDDDSAVASLGFAQRSLELSTDFESALGWAEKWKKWDPEAASRYQSDVSVAWVQQLAQSDLQSALSKAKELELAEQIGELNAQVRAQYLQDKKFEQALEGTDGETESAPVFRAWVEHLQEEGDFEEAIAIMQRWGKIASEPSEIERMQIDAYHSWAEGLYEAGHADAAIAVLEQLLASELALLNEGDERGKTEAKMKQYGPAEPEVSEPAVEEAPAEAEVVAEVEPEAPAEAPKEVPQEEAATEVPAAEESPTPESEAAESAEPVAEGDSSGWDEVAQMQAAGQWSEAESKAEKLGGPGWADFLLALAGHHLAQAQAEQTSATLERLLALADLTEAQRNSASALQNRVKVEQVIAGDSEQAEDFLRERMAEEPDNDDYHNALYKLHSGSSMSGRRLVDFYRDLQKNHPNEPAFLLQLARAYCNAGKDTLAVVQFRKLVQIAPQANFYAELATTYVRLGKGGDASKAIQSAAELDAQLPVVRLVQVQVFLSEGKVDEAKPLVESLRKEVSDDSAKAWLEQVWNALDSGTAPGADLISQLPNLLSL